MTHVAQNGNVLVIWKTLNWRGGKNVSICFQAWVENNQLSSWGWDVERRVRIRRLSVNLGETKSLYRSLPESTKELRTGGRQAARFNQPATRLASNPDLQICKHPFLASRFTQSSFKFKAHFLFPKISAASYKLLRCILVNIIYHLIIGGAVSN